MKILLFSWIILLATTSIFAQEPLMKVYLQDGSYKTYSINEIEDMSFNTIFNKYLLCIYTKEMTHFLKVEDISNMTIESLDKYILNINTRNGKLEYEISSVDSLILQNVKEGQHSMVMIPAGTFQMGNTGAYTGESNEKPVHTVTISKAFYMSKYEVTQKQYQALIGKNPSYVKGEKLPVVNVSWYDAVEFCNALSIIEGKTPCYIINGTTVTCNWDANGYRLPTEAEWEYACKAGTTTDFYSGSLTYYGTSPLDSNLDNIAWYRGNIGDILPQLVGYKVPNTMSLYDISGNVSEWCWDSYSSYTVATVTDPKGANTDSYRVYRGGSIFHEARSCRSSMRYYLNPNNTRSALGFRIVFNHQNSNTNELIINSITPNPATVRYILSIKGTNFGAERGKNYVNFSNDDDSGIKATDYVSWSDTEIKVKVPTGAKTGKMFVKIGKQFSNEIDLTIITDSALNYEMVLIPAGTFQMGNTGAFKGKNEEKPVHTVTISKAFYMSKYEITQKQYLTVMGTNPSNFIESNLPVEKVSWYDAVAFCNALSQLEGLTPCYSINGTDVTCNWDANGYRLPTEAEWEYAAKAGTTTDFYSGLLTNSNKDANLDKIGWYRGNSNGKTQPVGKKQPNAFGLYDMSGNVMEWCWDWYDSYTDATVTDPKGSTRVTTRVVRGGYWDMYASLCRSACRAADPPNTRFFDIGFRIVRVDS